MGGLRRFALIIFSVAGVLCLAALALPWVGPYQSEAAALMDNNYYYMAMLLVLGITAVGVVVTLLRALFTPRKRKDVVIDRAGGDRITVTTKAIQSQAVHAVEADGRFVAEKVRVDAKKRGVQLNVRVRPRNTVNLAQEGRVLHDELAGNLMTICGDRVRRINLEFVEAENPIPAENVTVEPVEALEVPDSVFEHAAQLEASEGVTVPAAVLSASAPAPGTNDAADAPSDGAAEPADGADTEGKVA